MDIPRKRLQSRIELEGVTQAVVPADPAGPAQASEGGLIVQEGNGSYATDQEIVRCRRHRSKAKTRPVQPSTVPTCTVQPHALYGRATTRRPGGAESLESAWGALQAFQIGDRMVALAEGECYIVPATEFQETYSPTSRSGPALKTQAASSGRKRKGLDCEAEDPALLRAVEDCCTNISAYMNLR